MKKRNGFLTAGLVLTCLLAAAILLGFFWTPYDPNAMAAGPKFAGPSLTHWMGTDNFGRDIFSRVLQGPGPRPPSPWRRWPSGRCAAASSGP